MEQRSESVPGTGLPLWGFLLLLGVSVGLFIVWGGILWNAPREVSHLGRFVVSYFAVIPLAALLLAFLQKFDWSRVITSTGTVWALKLVITVVLYQAFARGTAVSLRGVAPAPPTNEAAVPTEYKPASGAFQRGVIRGKISVGPAPAKEAVVFLNQPSPGAPPPTAGRVELVVSGSHYDKSIYLAGPGDAIDVVNRDAVLHTVHLFAEGKAPLNEPLPALPEPHRLGVSEPGVYRVRCDNHPAEGTVLVLVDHPYAVHTAGDGGFSLLSVPAGDVTLVAVANPANGIVRTVKKFTLTAGSELEVQIGLGAEERF